MNPYHKIQTVFKRDPETKYKTLLDGEYSLPEFEYLKNNLWIATEKVDGTNIRVISLPDGGTQIRGRTERAQIPITLLSAIQELLPPEKLNNIFGDDDIPDWSPDGK